VAHYFVGDVQGCYAELSLLLNRVDFNPSRDELWSVGDLIARGPDSLATLRFFHSLGAAAKVVLGNHDLHLMAVQAGLKRPHPQDKLAELLAADDLPVLIHWLRQQPLMREMPQHRLIMTHAGVPPQWTLDTLRAQSAAVSQALMAEDYLTRVIARMYGNSQNSWCDSLDASANRIFCINALTRMRYLHPDGRLDFDCKQPPADCTLPELSPWFEFPGALRDSHTLVFGHWAALMGQVEQPRLQALDTGCCWGHHLTLWHLEADQKITQQRLKKG
jgi:bis(5'-nucleosyl)-tetraphosphatase (symmetrical)